jgi:hypothetical protein
MKRSKLDAVLRRKVRLEITKRRRGHFEVVFPPALTKIGEPTSAPFPSRKAALTYLFVRLRCLPDLHIQLLGFRLKKRLR